MRRAGALAAALAVALAAAAVLAPVPARALQQRLLVAAGAGDEQLGFSVAVDGDTAVLGAPGFRLPGGGPNRGGVYVFERSGDSWVRTARLTASDGVPGDELGYDVAIDGETIVAAAADAAGAAVYTFARAGGDRTETAKLFAADGSGDGVPVSSVAIDGDTIVAGAPEFDHGRGAVYTFARTCPSTCFQTATLTASEGSVDDRLGTSVALAGDTIVAGAPGDGEQDREGAVYTFARAGGDRSETAKLTAAESESFDELGYDVAIEGETIVAGMPGDNVGADSNRGAVYTFARAGGDRTETARLTATDSEAEDELGFSVSIDGEAIAAGAIGDDLFEGAVYLFARQASDRTEDAKLRAPDGAADDLLGAAVALDGSTVLAGAPDDDVGLNAEQGSASIWFDPLPSPLPPSPPPSPEASAPPAAPLVSGPPRDTRAPSLGLALARRQRLRRALRLAVSCDEPCALRAGGRIVIADRRKARPAAAAPSRGKRTGRQTLRLNPTSASLAAGGTARLALRLTRRRLREAKRAARRGARLTAKLTVTATDAAGNRVSRRATVRIASAGRR